MDVPRAGTFTRNIIADEAILTGISTRGGISLAAAARAMAFLHGRDYVLPEDVKEMAVPTERRLSASGAECGEVVMLDAVLERRPPAGEDPPSDGSGKST